MILGEDRADNQVAMRDKLRPMLAILILMLSAIAIAGLVAVELERRTAAALLVTPVRVGDFLVAKGITGTVLGISQVLQTSKNVYIVLELVTGGELFDKIVEAKRFEEEVGRNYFQQLVLGVYYCHQQGIAHRYCFPAAFLSTTHLPPLLTQQTEISNQRTCYWMRRDA